MDTALTCEASAVPDLKKKGEEFNLNEQIVGPVAQPWMLLIVRDDIKIHNLSDSVAI